MDNELFDIKRKSHIEPYQIYFWTATIPQMDTNTQTRCNEGNDDRFARTFVKHKKNVVFGFVIMPNHIHLIWRLKTLNGKEMP